MSNATATVKTEGNEAKKLSRSPAISFAMMIGLIQHLAWTNNGKPKAEGEEPNEVTTSDIARWFNERVYSPDKHCSQWPLIEEGKSHGTRVHASIYQRINGFKKTVGDAPEESFGDKPEEARALKDELLQTLDWVTNETVDKEIDFRGIATGLKSLGLFRAPANMVPGSGHIGTNGNPVTETVDPNEVRRPKL